MADPDTSLYLPNAFRSAADRPGDVTITRVRVPTLPERCLPGKLQPGALNRFCRTSEKNRRPVG